MNSTLNNNLGRKLIFGFIIVIVLIGLIFAFLSINSSRTTTSNVIITNQSDNSVSIVWTTDKPVVGRVIVNEEDNLGEGLVIGRKGREFRDDRDIEEIAKSDWELKAEGEQRRYTHHVTIRGLEPNTSYFFRIKNGVLATKAETTSFSTTATLEAVETPDPVYGRVFNEGNSVIEDGIVMIRKVDNENNISQYKSGFLNNSTYTLDMANSRNSNLNGAFLSNEFREDITYFAAINNQVRSFNQLIEQDQDQPVNKVTFNNEQDINSTSSYVENNLGLFMSVVNAQDSCSYTCPDGQTFANAGDNTRCESYKVLNDIATWDSIHGQGQGCGAWKNIVASECAPQPRSCLNTEAQDCPVWTCATYGGYKEGSGPEASCENQQGAWGGNQNAWANAACNGSSIPPKLPGEASPEFCAQKDYDGTFCSPDSKKIITCSTVNGIRTETKQELCSPNVCAVTMSGAVCPEANVEEDIEQETDNSNLASCNSFINRNYECSQNISESENTERCKTSFGATYVCRLTENTTNIEEGAAIAVTYQNPSAECNHGSYTAPDLPQACSTVLGCPVNRNCSTTQLIDADVSKCSSNDGAGHIGIVSCCGLGDVIINGRCMAASSGDPKDTRPAECNYGIFSASTVSPECSNVTRCASGLDCIPEPLSGNNTIDKCYDSNSFSVYACCAPGYEINESKSCVPKESANNRINSLNKIFTKVSAQSGDLGSEEFDINNLSAGVYELEGDRILTKTIEVRESGPLRYYYDTNSNGVKDLGEEYLGEDEAQAIEISLRKTSDIETYTLNNGWNLIHIPMVADAATKASELVNEFNNQGAQVTHITSYRNGKFVVYSQRLDNSGRVVTFGNDFNILPGEGYFVRNYTNNTTVTLSGNKVEGSLELLIDPGWNLVGFYNENRSSYEGFDILRQMNQTDIEADVLSSWSGGVYTNLVLEDGVEYGADYRVFPTNGYWVRSKSSQAASFSLE